MYKNSFLYSFKKKLYIRYSPKWIGFVRRQFAIYIPNFSSIECTFRRYRVHSHAYTHTYITPKIARMNSGGLKTYKCVKISKSKFFTITIISLHSICKESKKKETLNNCVVMELLLWVELKFLINNADFYYCHKYLYQNSYYFYL